VDAISTLSHIVILVSIMKRAIVALLFAVPASAFLNPGKLGWGGQSTAPATANGASKPLVDAPRLRNSAAFSFPSLKMGLMDMFGGAGGKRDYADLAKGSWQEETAVYADAGEVKSVSKDGLSIATFGAGCFWGVELAYARVPGVVSTSVGYCQGKMEHPGYEIVCTGATGHNEVVHMTYDPKVVSYADLVRVLFTRINPALKDQVGNDRGTQYRHGVYFNTPQQKAEAEGVFSEVKTKLGEGAPFFTELVQAEVYYPAEEYHQQYLWAKGGRGGSSQSAEKGCSDTIRCYG